MAPFLLLELGTIPAYGIAAWLDIWNGLDVLTYFLQVRCAVPCCAVPCYTAHVVCCDGLGWAAQPAANGAVLRGAGL